jgi:hypothetical protein
LNYAVLLCIIYLPISALILADAYIQLTQKNDFSGKSSARENFVY